MIPFIFLAFPRGRCPESPHVAKCDPAFLYVLAANLAGYRASIPLEFSPFGISRTESTLIRSEPWQPSRLASPATRPLSPALQPPVRLRHAFWNWMAFALPRF